MHRYERIVRIALAVLFVFAAVRVVGAHQPAQAHIKAKLTYLLRMD